MLDLGAVGAGSAGYRDIQQKQIVYLSGQQALLKKPQLVVQVGQGFTQQGNQPTRSPSSGPMQRRVQRQLMQVAVEGPYVHLRLTGQMVHGMAVGEGQKRMADVQQTQLHAGDAAGEQVPDQLGLRMAVAGSQGEHLERATSAGGGDPPRHLTQRHTASQRRQQERRAE